MRIKSQLQIGAENFQSYRAANLERLEQLESYLQKAREGDARGGERMRKQGKMLPRERLRGLLDDESPFLELCPLAALGFYNDEAIGGFSVGPASVGSPAAGRCWW